MRPCFLDTAAARIDRDGLAARREESAGNGRLRGQGIALYAANCGGCNSETARMAGFLVGS